MSRAASGETIVLKPTNNIYTVLVIAAVIVQLIAIVAIAMRHAALFPEAKPLHLFF